MRDRSRTGEKGSLTVEASVAVSVVLCVILSIAFIIKAVYVHELIQHSISETANELSVYSYVLAVSGAAQEDRLIVEKLDEAGKKFNEHLDSYAEGYHSLKEFTGETRETLSKGMEQIKEGDLRLEELGEIKNSYEDVKTKLEGAVKSGKEAFENPKAEAVGMLGSFAALVYDDVKGSMLGTVSKAFVTKYLKSATGTDANARLKSLHVEDGLDGLDFSQSRLFSDGKNIDIIVRYKLKLVLPIKLMPDLYIIQRANVRGWLDGEAGESAAAASDEKSDIWAMADLARGKKIQEMYHRNLPANYPVLTRFEGGAATKVRSINLRSATYKKTSNVKNCILGETDQMADFQGKNYGGVNIKNTDIKSRKLIIVVPKGEINAETRKAMDECAKKAKDKKVELVIEEL